MIGQWCCLIMTRSWRQCMGYARYVGCRVRGAAHHPEGGAASLPVSSQKDCWRDHWCALERKKLLRQAKDDDLVDFDLGEVRRVHQEGTLLEVVEDVEAQAGKRRSHAGCARGGADTDQHGSTNKRGGLRGIAIRRWLSLMGGGVARL